MHGFGYAMHGFEGAPGGFEIGGLVMMISMLLFWALIIGAIIYAARVYSGRHPAAPVAPGGESKALEILKERYARGEIDTEEFAARKKELTQ
ncbi:MAG TPA: SHOCT domain-containing protein [Candidatus Aquicultor sp.]|jgi:putative membrane protein